MTIVHAMVSTSHLAYAIERAAPDSTGIDTGDVTTYLAPAMSVSMWRFLVAIVGASQHAASHRGVPMDLRFSELCRRAGVPCDSKRDRLVAFNELLKLYRILIPVPVKGGCELRGLFGLVGVFVPLRGRIEETCNDLGRRLAQHIEMLERGIETDWQDEVPNYIGISVDPVFIRRTGPRLTLANDTFGRICAAASRLGLRQTPMDFALVFELSQRRGNGTDRYRSTLPVEQFLSKYSEGTYRTSTRARTIKEKMLGPYERSVRVLEEAGVVRRINVRADGFDIFQWNEDILLLGSSGSSRRAD